MLNFSISVNLHIGSFINNPKGFNAIRKTGGMVLGQRVRRENAMMA